MGGIGQGPAASPGLTGSPFAYQYTPSAAPMGAPGGMGSGAEALQAGSPLGTGMNAGQDPTGAARRQMSTEELQRIHAQLGIANSVSGLAGMLGQATQGPPGSPLMARGQGGAMPFTPTAGQFGRRPRRLSDLL